MKKFLQNSNKAKTFAVLLTILVGGVIYLLINKFPIIILKDNPQMTNEEYISLIHNNLGEDIDIEITKIKYNSDTHIGVEYNITANKDVYILDSLNVLNECHDSTNEILVNNSEMYSVTRAIPNTHCMPYTSRYFYIEPNPKMMLLRKGEQESEYSDLMLKTNKNNKKNRYTERVPFKENKKLFLTIGYIPAELVNDPVVGIKTAKNAKIIERNNTKYIKTDSWGRDLQKYEIQEIIFPDYYNDILRNLKGMTDQAIEDYFQKVKKKEPLFVYSKYIYDYTNVINISNEDLALSLRLEDIYLRDTEGIEEAKKFNNLVIEYLRKKRDNVDIQISLSYSQIKFLNKTLNKSFSSENEKLNLKYKECKEVFDNLTSLLWEKGVINEEKYILNEFGKKANKIIEKLDKYVWDSY